MSLQTHLEDRTKFSGVLGRPDVFAYKDYRQFLKDSYEHRKALRPGFSMRVIARHLGKSSSSYFKLIIDGKRDLTLDVIPSIGVLFKLAEQELAYFASLVQLNHSTIDSERNVFERELNRLRPLEAQRILENQYLEILSSWYGVPLMELVCRVDFVLDSEWIARQFNAPLTNPQIVGFYEKLQKLGLMWKNSDGRWAVSPLTQTAVDVPRSVVRAYHSKAHMAGSEMVNRIPVPKRDFTSMTLATQKENFGEIQRRCREFYQSLAKDFGVAENATAVYQVNIQLFPWSEKE